MALGVITKYVYSILHGPKSCNFRIWAVVGIAVGKIGNGQRVQVRIPVLNREKGSEVIFDSTWSEIM